MTYTVLDIGAGSRTFAKRLAASNKRVRMTIFCGEPSWGMGPLFKAITEEQQKRILTKGTDGVWRISSTYECFEVPDASLDLITLNAPHPFMPPGKGLAGEIERTLKPGGLFFSSYPKYDFGVPPKGFERIAQKSWGWDSQGVHISPELLPAGAPDRFPKSPCIDHNIRVHRYGNPKANGTSYLYFDGISPGYRLWRKPE